ncbi:hypothetical protein ACOME3_000974 [Neoechinorhynchus agilis]
MDVHSNCSGHLCDFEVLEYLQKRIEFHKEHPNSLSEEQYKIITDLHERMKTMPCAAQTRDYLRPLIEGFSLLPITDFEKRQIINLAPKSTVELEMILSKSMVNLTAEQSAKIVEMLNSRRSQNS